MSIADKLINRRLLNKIRGIETVPVTQEQMLELLKREFISKAESPQDYNVLWRTVKGALFFPTKPLTSKDGNYEIHRFSSAGYFLGGHYIMVHDKRQNRDFMFRSVWRFGKMKKAVRTAIAEAKMNPL